MKKVKGFVGEVQNELKKVSWPTRQELIDSTIIVIISAIIMAVFIGFADFILKFIMALLIR
ncbi:preprotein translocase subunit SecE [bacterium]|nr:preprotein translocase subunit SecE [bacterium]